MLLPEQLITQIESYTGKTFSLQKSRSVAGGCINHAVSIETGDEKFFIKFNTANLVEMFNAEAAGLKELAKAAAIKVPAVIASGCDQQQSWLILQHLQFAHGSADASELAGRQLAQLHHFTQAQHGWHQNNFIGSSPQINPRHDSWIDFWKQARLGYQLNLARQKSFSGKVIQLTERLILDCDPLINHQPAASLLHGDLWSGNLAYSPQGQPVIFDPAVYYGDHETDLAMTELFGGFSSRFYRAYQEIMPISPDYRVRKQLYNLYHILNHMNIFGGGYGSQAAGMAERLLAELR